MALPQFLTGTASWTDPTLVKSDAFYPPDLKSAEDRLRFYAAQFPTVEVDSTYYALPAERNAQLWAARTPPGFIFNLKAFALLTQHPADTARLPAVVREALPPAARTAARLRNPPDEILKLSFNMFWSALAPLRAAGKLGHLLFQFPPYFIRRSANLDYLASLPERMPGASIAIEFRHASWLAAGAARDATLKFLRERGFTYVSIDAPPATVASFLEATGPDAYVRFHGRNRENWYRRDISAAERYKYLYSERELAQWANRLRGLGERGVSRAFVIFNNCYANFGIMNATTMAQMLRH
jgi:uncharacterized protein YecE (DUF72 family)